MKTEGPLQRQTGILLFWALFLCSCTHEKPPASLAFKDTVRFDGLPYLKERPRLSYDCGKSVLYILPKNGDYIYCCRIPSGDIADSIHIPGLRSANLEFCVRNGYVYVFFNDESTIKNMISPGMSCHNTVQEQIGHLR